ncbi:subunit alpha of cyclic nucleotide-gated channel cone photoreceptor [Chloropicon primus]|uniref:Subunit alpha of cyclic nucleotide-gated channel cone photoreceptor n=1 Tax=Chloropicon primus TaxID=1764295 RepID=A0A5B8ML10_9CHLO|nr:subunit alpha of cyclic nucleotide-gated channel cone photoreceptor [Chloropicon primus]UPR00370.1 subunit alpha of cyclic nucleotide-gated channel cone photoreceptor [Chloropicon primus]|eukprot:QDZ21156.1 subunit alpha of cyclic nucleotide-gated channel cone photoreceptor [Chloropicon primus]
MASMAQSVAVLDASKKADFARNDRRGSVGTGMTFERDGQHSPRQAQPGKVRVVKGGSETAGSQYVKAPASFFKNVMAKAPSFRSVNKWSNDNVIEETDSSSSLDSCFQVLKEWWDKIPLRHVKIIRPDSKNKRNWVRVIMCATLYSVTLNPIQLAFNTANTTLPITIIDVICDALFMLDIYILLRTAVVLDNKFLKSSTHIRNHHLKSANFYFDVVSSFPTGIVQLIYPSNAWRTVRILKVLRLSKVGRILKEFSPDKFNTSDMQRLLILLFYLLVATHLNACAFIMINRLNDWPSHFFIPGVDPDDLYQTYTGSVCWALMSLTGIGAILTPITIDENIFVLVNILVGVFVYAIILGNVYSTLANYQYLETAYLRKVSSVLEFCKYRNVPEETQKKVTMYYRLMWSRNKGIQDALLLEDMTKPLRQEILMHSFKNIFNKCKWVKTASEHHKKILAENLRNEIYMPREVIVNAGESPLMVYMISRGTIGVIGSTTGSSGKGKGQELVGILKDGCVYGAFHIAKNFLHNATLKTQTFVEVAVLHANDYIELKHVIPELQALEDKHLEQEVGDIIVSKKKKNSPSTVSNMNLGRQFVNTHRRDSLANKLLGILGSYGGGGASNKIKPADGVVNITDLDQKASAGTTDELFKAKDQDHTDGNAEGNEDEGPSK